MLRTGTFTSSKKICAVSELRMPSLSSFFTTCTPLVFIGRQISDLFLCTGTLAGVGQQAHPVGLRAVGGPHLAAVDHPVAADPPGRGLERGDVGARADFGDAEAGDVVAGDRGRQELAAQLVAAVAGERRRRHVGLHADRHRHRAAIDVAQLLGHHHGVGVVEAHAAEFDGLVDAEQAGIAQLLEHLVGGEDARPPPTCRRAD